MAQELSLLFKFYFMSSKMEKILWRPMSTISLVLSSELLISLIQPQKKALGGKSGVSVFNIFHEYLILSIF
jgi:hypothetical protein